MKARIRSMMVAATMALATGSQAASVVSYDAATAGAGNDPTAVVPAWTKFGTAMSNNGTFLLQDNTTNGNISGEYLSPSVAGLMKFTNSNYGIAFKVQPLGDIPLVGGSVYGNLNVTWSDDQYIYNVTIDKFTDDVGGTGGIRYGQNSLSAAVTGINWSLAHQVGIGYRGNAAPYGEFDFYLDGILASTISAGNMARTPGFPFAQNAVDFGDGTSAGSNVAAQWYYVSLYNTAAEAAIPEPSTAMLAGLAGLLVWMRRSL